MNSAADVIERMMVVTGSKSLRDLAPHLGLTRTNAISTAKSKGVIPKKWLRTLEIEQDINPGWLLTGSGERTLKDHAPGARISTPTAEITSRRPLAGIVESPTGHEPRHPVEYVAPPMLRPWLNEQGQAVPDPEAGPSPALPKTWVQAAGADPDSLAALVMPSRDMEPELHEKDVVILDRKDAKPVHGRLYCIAVNDSLLVRRYAGDLAVFAGERQDSRPIPAQDAAVVGKVVLWVRR